MNVMPDRMVTTPPDDVPPPLPAAPSRSARRAGRARRTLLIWLVRLAVIVAFLATWQWGPEVGFLTSWLNFLDPFYISSPAKVATEVWNLLTGSGGNPTIWPYLGTTIAASMIGTAVGVVLGAAGGLLLSNSDFAASVCRPFIIAINAIPRVALIPVIVIIAGPTATSSAITAVIIVVFIVFFNAFEGGRSIAPEMIQNARILGAGNASVMARVRLPYVLAWTFATLPNAISFGLVGAVTAEILTGATGVGQLLQTAVSTINATLTFGIVVILAVVGVLLVMLTTLARGRLLRWWDRGDAGGMV